MNKNTKSDFLARAAKKSAQEYFFKLTTKTQLALFLQLSANRTRHIVNLNAKCGLHLIRICCQNQNFCLMESKKA